MKTVLHVEEYVREDGAIPYKAWFDSLGLLAEYKARKAAKRRQRKEMIVALTRDFKQTVVERVERDPAFAKAMLDEAATLFLNGEPELARIILRDLVNATVGFEELAQLTEKPPKSLHRMLSPNGNPSMDNLAAIFGAVSSRLNVELEAHTVETASG
jgi:DNA-binding phage protein